MDTQETIRGTYLVPGAPWRELSLKDKARRVLLFTVVGALVAGLIAMFAANGVAGLGAMLVTLPIMATFFLGAALANWRESRVTARRVWRGLSMHGSAPIEFGADGIVLNGVEFVPYSRVRGYAWERHALLYLQIEGMEEEVAACLGHDQFGPVTALLERGRAIAAEQASVEALPIDGAAYRDCTIDRAQLVRIAQDPTANPAQRVAACEAFARSGAPAPEEVSAIDAAMRETAHPKVRIALKELEELARPSDEAVSSDRQSAAG
jgi:hypothetical protein